MRTLPLAFLVPCFAASLAVSAVAGTHSEKSAILPESPPTGNQWFTLDMNGWLSAVEGDIGIRRLSAPADMSIGEVLDDLDFGFMGYAEFGRDRWSLGLDVVYAKLSRDTSFSFGPIDGRVDLAQEQAFLTPRVQYRLIQSESHTLDVFGGIRWSYIDIDIEVRTALSFDRPALRQFNRTRQRHFDLGRDWVDPILGFRHVVQLDPDWFLRLEGDIGGFGSSSELTWQAVTGVGYSFKPNASVLAGYRAMGMDYDRKGLKLDTISHGPLVVFRLAY